MCGIGGYFGSGDPALLARMNDMMRHRGPDDAGTYVADGVGLAHQRLAVIDLSEAGHQPMVAPDGLALVFNGEIYNFRQIRADLEKRGHSFQSQSDTEVVLHAYRQWGQDCVNRFRGMFAFAIWDPRDRSLFLARDRLGIKPLYYLQWQGSFYFASEAKALLAVPGFRPRVDLRALSLYLTFRFTPGENTLFAGIKKLLPGHTMLLSPDRAPLVQRYWELHYEPDEGPTASQWQERFWGTFEEAVRLRLVSDVPLGAYLSGGLDSSLIVAAMSEVTGRQIDAFSVGFADERFSELEYAREVADSFACRHHILHAERDSGAILNDVVRHLDEPLGDLATIPTYLMARETKRHVTVVLSGEGADELLAGYPKYRAFLVAQALRRLCPSAIPRMGSTLFKNSMWQRGCGMMTAESMAGAYLQMAAVFTGAELDQLCTPGVRVAMMPHGEQEEIIARHFRKGYDGLSALLALDLHTWLVDDLLLKNDKMTMAHGVEARVPYLDHELVELCAKIPSRFKLRMHREKVLLREVMKGRLPERIRRRKKTGFTVPLADWMRRDFGQKVKQVLASDFVREQELFDWKAVERLKQQPLDRLYHRRQVWTLAALGLWMAEFGVEV